MIFIALSLVNIARITIYSSSIIIRLYSISCKFNALQRTEWKCCIYSEVQLPIEQNVWHNFPQNSEFMRMQSFFSPKAVAKMKTFRFVHKQTKNSSEMKF